MIDFDIRSDKKICLQITKCKHNKYYSAFIFILILNLVAMIRQVGFNQRYHISYIYIESEVRRGNVTPK